MMDPASPGLSDVAIPSTTEVAKRKVDANAGSGTRPKRNRYISLACNECKRRKIKCNGQTPCQRCGHLGLECLYAPNCCNNNFRDSHEFRAMTTHIEKLQEQVNTLFANVNDLCHRHRPLEPPVSETTHSYTREPSHNSSRYAPVTGSSTAARPYPRYLGPMSNAFSLDVARSSLQTMGIASVDGDGREILHTPEPIATEKSPHAASREPEDSMSDPLLTMSREECYRLCRIYEEEVWIMYPLCDAEAILAKAHQLFNLLESTDRTGNKVQFPSEGIGLYDDDMCILRMITAIGLVIERNGYSDLGGRLFCGVKEIVKLKMWESSDISTAVLLALIGSYYFLLDDDIMAFRRVGCAARMCFELGLHNQQGLLRFAPNPKECIAATRIFWSIYTLDRRFSFGTGLPFSIQDDDIDSALPRPDDGVPFLKIVVPFYQLGTKVWYEGMGANGATKVRPDVIGFLDYRLLELMREVPEEMKLYRAEPYLGNQDMSRRLYRLRVLIHIRANHMRMLIYRPVLQSTTTVLENIAYAKTAVEVAKDTIHVLTQLNMASDIYSSMQISFHYYLVASLAVLLLAISHAPSEFNYHVRQEFYMALSLVKSFSSQSFVSRRLWQMMKGLREIGQQLGLSNSRPVQPEATNTPTSTATTMPAMAGLPVEPVMAPDDFASQGQTLMNDSIVSNELSVFFEAIHGYGSYPLETMGNLDDLNVAAVHPEALASSGMNGEIPTSVHISSISHKVTDEVAEDVARLDLDQQSESASSTFVSDMTSFSDEISDTWIATYCSLMGHEFFAEVSEDFIEDDFNLTGLQAQVPLFKEALEMILDVEPDEEEDEEEEEEEEEDDGILGDEKPPGYRRPERKHARVASDLSVIESSAELLYGLIHQRYITSRPGIQQMVEKYELQHFGVCPRVFCNGCRVLPVGRSDTPGVDTVKLFCPSCQDIYTPPNSRFQAIDGAFFGTTFGSLFFMTFPEFDVGLSRDSALPSANPSSPPGAAPAQEPVAPPNQPETINGVLTSNLAPGLGHGKIYEQRIYGFRVSERARTGPRMRWLRMKPADITELDEYSIFHVRAAERDEEDDGDGDVEMPSPEPESQQAAIEQRKKAPLRKPRLGQKNGAGDG